MELDTKQFEEALKKLNKQYKETKEQAVSMSNNVSDHLEKVADTAEKLKKENEQLSGSIKQTSKNVKEQAEDIKSVQKGLDNWANAEEKVVKTNEKLKKSNKEVQTTLKETEKQIKKTVSSLQNQFNQHLWERVWNLGGKKVFSNSIKGQMKDIYGSNKEFNKLWNQSLKDLNIKFLPMGDDGFLDMGGLVKPTQKATEEVDKLNSKLGETINLNKKVSSSFKTPDLSKQMKFNEELYEWLSAVADKDLGMGKTSISLKKIRKEFKDFAKDAKELDALITTAVHDLNMPLKSFGEGKNTTFWIKDLKKPLEEVKVEVQAVSNEEKKLTNNIQEQVSLAKKASEAVTRYHEANVQSIYKESEASEKYRKQLRKSNVSSNYYINPYSNKYRNERYPTHFSQPFGREILKNAMEASKIINGVREQVGNESVKSSGLFAQSSEKNIKSVKKEADNIKYYTEYEIKMMKNWQSSFEYMLKRGETLYPIDAYKNYGGRKSEYFKNYSSLLNSNRRGKFRLTGVYDDYANDDHNDYAKHFQKRMKELMADLGVKVSDFVNGEFKQVKDKTTGKMVEYPDVTHLKDNRAWLQKVQEQMWGLKHFQEDIEKIYRMGINEKDILYKSSLRELKNKMDFQSKYDYDQYGVEGNPYIKRWLKEQGIYKKYREAQRVYGKNGYYTNYNFTEVPQFALDKAGKAWATLNRALKSTPIKDISFKQLTSETKQLVQAVKPLGKKISLEGLRELSKTTLTNNISKAVTQANKLATAMNNVEKETTETTVATKKYSEVQTQILKDIFKTASVTKNAQTLNNTQYANKSPFKDLYSRLESEYLKPLTGSDFSTVISPRKLRSRFQHMLKPLFEDLGIEFTKEVPETFRMGNIEKKFKAINFAGKRVGMYDVSNLIDESAFKKMIGEVEQLGTVEDTTTTKTNKLKETLKGLGSSFLLGAGNRDSIKSMGIIDELTKMAEANEKASYTVKEISKSQRYISEMKRNKYNFGFTGLDAEDAHYIQSTLRAVKESQIKPVKFFDRDELEVLKTLYTEGKNRVGKKLSPLSSLDLLDVPSRSKLKKQLKQEQKDGIDRSGLERIYSMTDWIDPLEAKNYEKYLKQYHTRIREIMDYLNISFSKEKIPKSDGKNFAGKKIWNEKTGKMETVYSIDYSNMKDMGSIKEFHELLDTTNRSIDIFEKKHTVLGETIDKTKVKTTEFGESLKENILPLEEVARAEDKATVQAERLSEAHSKLGEGKIESWGTETEFRNAEKNFGRLLDTLDNIKPKTVETTDSVKKMGETTNKVSEDAKKAKTSLDDFANTEKKVETETKKVADTTKKSSEEIERLSESFQKISQSSAGRFSAKNMDTLVSAQKQITEKELKDKLRYASQLNKLSREYKSYYRETSTVGIGTFQGVSGIMDKLMEQSEKQKEELRRLQAEYKQLGESGNYSGMSIYQQYKNIIPITIKAREELTKLGAKNKEVAEWIGKIGMMDKKSPQGYLQLYVGQIQNQYAQIKSLEIQAQQALERTLSERRGVSEGFGQLNPNMIKDYATQMVRLGRVGKETATNMKRLKEYMNIPPRYVKNIENIFQKLARLDRLDSVIAPIDSRNLRYMGLNGAGDVTEGDILANTTRSLRTLDSTVLTTAEHIRDNLIDAIKKLKEQNKDNDEFVPPVEQWQQAINEINAFIRRYEVLQQRMYELSRGMGKWRNQGKVNTGYGATLDAQKIAKMMGATVAGEYSLTDIGKDLLSKGSKGRVNVEGYSDYVARIHEVQSALESTTTSTNHYHESLIQLSEALKANSEGLSVFSNKATEAVSALTRMAEANEIGHSIDNLSSRLEHFSGLSNKNADHLLKFNNEAKYLKDTFRTVSEQFAQGNLTQQQYDSSIARLSERFQKLEGVATKSIREVNLLDSNKAKSFGDEIHKGTQSLNEFGKKMGESERYVNGLYRGLQKARSVIISMKTILRFMGTMEIWNFGFELIEGVKETYTAKNEMESLLAKNKKIDASGVATFNKALDNTISRFQKMNKYNLGEIGASIGVEFNLSAKELEKSLPIIAMVQNEYVRAGRTIDEANLAVKDILQGEFMRLSRETGIGKEDLQDKYGWNGDKSDVLDLMKALEKAGKERHWEIFASKATSLNDVLQITKSRFGELGAEIVTVSEPMIVSGFNTILGAVDSLKKGFEGLGSFGKTFTIITGGTAGLVAVSGAFMVLAKGMGALDLATLGWGKSLATTLFQLNRTDVALHGFWKTLIATTSGVKASEVANISFGKLLAGRVLGVNQLVNSELGLGKAMVHTISKYKEGKPLVESINRITGEHINLEKASLLTKDKLGIIEGKIVQTELTRSQRLAYLTTNMKYARVAEMGMGEALLRTATSAKVLWTAFKGLMVVGIASWLAGLYTWTDKVKKNIEGFNNLVDNGSQMVQDAKDDYQNIIDLTNENAEKIAKAEEKGKPTNDLILERNKLLEDQRTAYKNIGDVQRANAYAQDKSEKLKDKRSKIDTEIKDLKAKALMKVGNNKHDAEVFATDEWSQAKGGYYYAKQALNEYKREYEELIAVEEQHGLYLKENKVDQEKVNQFMADFGLKAQETAEHLKQFNEGDIWAGLYYVLDRLTLEWIKFQYSVEGEQFFGAVKRFVTWVEPKLQVVIGYLKELAKWGINAFSWLTSTEAGNWTLAIAGMATGIGLVSLKIGKWVTGSKSVFGVLKTVGGKLKDVAKGWKDVGKKAEEAEKKTPKTTPEGSTVPTNSEYRYKDWGEWKGDVKQDFMGNARNFLKYGTQIAMAMGLITEAIILMEAPMYALAKVGEDFKPLEPNIRKGIDGLKLIAPVIAVFLPPVVALMYIMGKFEDAIGYTTIAEGFVKSAGAIALTMVLISESIGLLVMPMMALGGLGGVYSSMESNVKKGTEAMKTVASSLIYLAPFIPVFVLATLMVEETIVALPLGLAEIGSVVLGIGLGMVLVSEAILGLYLPLKSIETLGTQFKDLSGVKQGAEALKTVAEAMTYVAEALGLMILIDWEIIAEAITQLIGVKIGADFSSLTNEGGFFDQLNSFIDSFNNFEFKSPEPDKVTAMQGIGDTMSTIADAMKNVKTAMDNLPEEFKNPKATLKYDPEKDKTAIDVPDVGSYFETFKEPLKQLDKFVKWFNGDELKFDESVDTGKLEAITSASDMISQVNDVVQNVKTTMQGVGDSQWNASYAGGGILSAVGNYLFHMTGEGAINNGSSSGEYKSSLGSSLQEMENVVSDLFHFQDKISGYGEGEGGEGTDVSGIGNMVTIIQDAITQISQALSDAIPNMETHGKSLSGAIVNGFNSGLKGIGNIPSKIANTIMTNRETLYNTATALGNTTYKRFKTGADPMSDSMGWELYYVGQAIGEKKEELGQKAYDLGSFMAGKFKDGAGIASPGIMARSVQAEMGYIGDYLSVNNLPQMAFDLASALSSNFNIDFGLSNIQLPSFDAFTQSLTQVLPTVDTVKNQVSTNFETMKLNVGNSFSTIVSKTRNSLSNMKSATINNIGNIKSSWKGMQDALIASADHIKTQTTTKINKLKTNLGDFWDKVKHPDQLIGGSAGGFRGSIRRRNFQSVPTGNYAGGFNFKPKTSSSSPSSGGIEEYLKCLVETGKPCYAGGWSFNWSPSISRKFKGWKTHFAKFHLDDYLNVGKFENSNFPVKGNAEVAKAYIYDVIKATRYKKYFNSNYGDDPVSALRAGEFNCWDGTQIVLALARAFGFDGSMGHGTWNGTGHVWANIAGLGIIDPTAIQGGYGFTSSKVKGYNAGGSIRRSKPDTPPEGGDTYNTNIEIHVHGDDVTVNDRKIDERSGKKILDILGINPATGR